MIVPRQLPTRVAGDCPAAPNGITFGQSEPPKASRVPGSTNGTSTQGPDVCAESYTLRDADIVTRWRTQLYAYLFSLDNASNQVWLSNRSTWEGALRDEIDLFQQRTGLLACGQGHRSELHIFAHGKSDFWQR